MVWGAAPFYGQSELVFVEGILNSEPILFDLGSSYVSNED